MPGRYRVGAFTPRAKPTSKPKIIALRLVRPITSLSLPAVVTSR